jgi:hypothetical protein
VPRSDDKATLDGALRSGLMQAALAGIHDWYDHERTPDPASTDG